MITSNSLLWLPLGTVYKPTTSTRKHIHKGNNLLNCPNLLKLEQSDISDDGKN